MLLPEVRRFVRRNAALTISGVCVLGIGLGASALVFAWLLALTSPQLPGMRGMSYATVAEAAQGGGSEPIDWNRYQRVRTSAPGANWAAYSRALTLEARAAGREVNVKIAAVSGGFWGAFTPSLAAGRDFYENEETTCQPRALILSYRSAVRLFGSPSDAIGKLMPLNGQAYEIVGAGPPSFSGVFDRPVDGWVPPACLLSLKFPGETLGDARLWRKIAWFYAIGGERALSVSAFVRDTKKNLPRAGSAEAPLQVTAGLTTDPVRDGRLLRWLRLGYIFALAFTLMSGMNYAILVLARAPAQIAGLQVKTALGASPAHLLRDLILGPSVMVAVAMSLAWAICLSGLAYLPHLFPAAKNICEAAWPHVGFVCAVVVSFSCLLTGLIAFAPAASVLRPGRGRLSAGYTATASRGTVLLLDSVVTVQILLCSVMAVTAGMVTASAFHLLRTPLGFQTANLSVIALGPRDTTAPLSVEIDTTNPDRSSFPASPAIRKMLHSLASLPGVRNVGYSENLPLQEPLSTVSVELVGRSAKFYTVGTTIVTQGFFPAMGIRLLRGGLFPRNESQAANEVVISRSLALELSPGGDSLGKTIRIVNPAASGLPSFSHTATVIGVVDDVKEGGPASSAEPIVYSCAFGSYFFESAPYFVLRGIEPEDLPRSDIARRVGVLMPGLTVQDMFSLRDRVSASMIPEEERAGAVAVLALVIASLAFLGLAGSLSFYVATRRRELAVRVCFGATPWRIRGLIMRRAAVCGGIAALSSLLTWPFLARLSSSDYLGSVSWSFARAAACSLLCFGCVIALSLIPARAAIRASPSELLKDY
jgi:putative ABC transport system permease protein